MFRSGNAGIAAPAHLGVSMRRKLVLLVVGGLLASALVASPGASAAPRPEPGPTVFVGQLTPEQLQQLAELGLDRGDLTARRGASKDTTSVEVVLTLRQAAKLNGLGLKLTEKKVNGATVSQRMSRRAASGYSVFRSYSEPGASETSSSPWPGSTPG